MDATGSPSSRPIRKAPGSIAWKAKRSVLPGFQPSSVAQPVIRATSSALAVAISNAILPPIAASGRGDQTSPAPYAVGRTVMKRLGVLLALLLLPASASAQQWVASWTGAAHGPYPIGNPTAQPELKFAFPTPVDGARDQTFRLIVKPGV